MFRGFDSHSGLRPGALARKPLLAAIIGADNLVPWLNWIRQLPAKQYYVGSSPTGTSRLKGDGMGIDYADTVMFGNNVPCPNPGCRNHVTHPCEMCGRRWAQGVASVRMGWLRVWKEEEIVEKKKWEVIP